MIFLWNMWRPPGHSTAMQWMGVACLPRGARGLPLFYQLHKTAPLLTITLRHYEANSQLAMHTQPQGALVKSGSANVRICGCCVRIRAGINVRVRIRVRDGVRISNRVRRRVKLVNYSLITALPIATSADPHIRLSTFYPWPTSSTGAFSLLKFAL